MNREEVLELIELGFEPELINLEFGVPVEKIKKFIKQDNERKEKEAKTKINHTKSTTHVEEKKTTTTAVTMPEETLKQTIPEVEQTQILQPKTFQTRKNVQTTSSAQKKVSQSRAKTSHTSRLETIRKKYQSVYFVQQDSSKNLTEIKQPTPEQEQQINEALDRIVEKSEQFDTLTTSREKKELLYSILDDDIKSIIDLPKTLPQLVQLNKLLSNQKFENIILSRNQNPNAKLNKNRKLLNTQLHQLVDELALQTSDLSELRALQQSLVSARLRSGVNIFADATRNRIESKIGRLQVQTAMDNIRNNVSPEIQELVQSIANDSFDEKEAKAVIDLEAKRRVDAAPKTRFALTQERQAKQVEIQIRTLLSEQGNKYPIQNPGNAINSLMTLSHDLTKENAFRIIIENLIEQGKIQVAQDLCDKYIMFRKFGVEETNISKTARQLKRKIIYSQIGDMVLKEIKKPSDSEEDDIFMDMLESRLTAEKIPLSQIDIGRSQNGAKKITLADIWYKTPTIQK